MIQVLHVEEAARKPIYSRIPPAYFKFIGSISWTKESENKCNIGDLYYWETGNHGHISIGTDESYSVAHIDVHNENICRGGGWMPNFDPMLHSILDYYLSLE